LLIKYFTVSTCLLFPQAQQLYLMMLSQAHSTLHDMKTYGCVAV